MAITFEKVIDNIKKHYESSNKDDKNFWASNLSNMLDDMLGEDFFGTEGQFDPRGNNIIKKQ